MRRIEWSDLTEGARKKASATLMLRGRIKREEAEEIVAIAVERLMRLRPEVRDPTSLLVTTALNVLRSDRREKALRPIEFSLPSSSDAHDDSSHVHEYADTNTDHVADLIEQDLRARTKVRLARAIRQLAPMDQALITAHYFEGQPLTAIDEARGDRPGTAKVRLFRARERLAILLDDLQQDPSRFR